jgi:hypothetical protein
MKFQFSLVRSSAVAVVAALGLVVACSDEPTTGGRAPSQAIPVDLEISARTAAPGSRVAVAVRVEALAGAVGGIHGTLAFDAARLRYVGQSAEGSAITIANHERAETGELEFTSFNQAGIAGRVARFVFEVRGAGYADRLAYRHKLAVSAGRNLRRLDVAAGRAPLVSASLVASADARRLTVLDWAAMLGGPVTRSPIARRPGEYRNGLVYGDVDFDASVGLFDFLGVANAAVGNDQIIIGTDGPAIDVDLVIAGNVSPDNGAGACGTEFDGSRVLDLFDFLAISNEAVGVNEACVGDLIPGRGPLPTTVQSLSTTSTPDLTVTSGETLTLTNDRIWQLEGILRVLEGGTLVIQPGTTVQGNTAAGTTTAVFVERGGLIFANGTQNQPVTFTCSANPKAKGCWGGVFIAGKGRVNLGQDLPGEPPFGCNERAGEGNAPNYGGCLDNDNSGSLTYVVIEYAGRIVGANNELNGLTLGAVGSATVVDHIQIHGGIDDGLEFFGGSVNVKHLVLTGNDDDQFDFSFGWKGDAQFVITQADAGDLVALDSKAIEADNTEPAPGSSDAPRTSPRLWNFTIVGNLAATQDDGAFHLRRGTGPSINNFLVIGYPIGLDMDDPLTCSVFTGPDAGTPPSISTTTFIDVPNLGNNDGSDPAGAGCPGVTSATEGEEQLINGVASNRTRTGVADVLFDALNTNLPDWRMKTVGGIGVELGASPPAGSIFSPAPYRGAVAPANTFGDIPWYSGWTRPFQGPTTP